MPAVLLTRYARSLFISHSAIVSGIPYRTDAATFAATASQMAFKRLAVRASRYPFIRFMASGARTPEPIPLCQCLGNPQQFDRFGAGGGRAESKHILPETLPLGGSCIGLLRTLWDRKADV